MQDENITTIIKQLGKELENYIGEAIYLSDVCNAGGIGIMEDDEVWVSDDELFDNDADYDVLTARDMLHVNNTADKVIFYPIDITILEQWRSNYDYNQVKITKEMIEELTKIK